MTFDKALQAMRKGKRIRRESWTDKDYYYEIRKHDYIPGGEAIYNNEEHGLMIEFECDLVLADDWEIWED